MAGHIVAGIGCRRGAAAADIVEAVQAAATMAGCAITLLAAPAFKRDEPGLRAAAAALQLDLVFVEEAALAAVQGRCVTASAAARRTHGIGAVAEGCALAALGPTARLIVPRIARGGATCAVAAAG